MSTPFLEFAHAVTEYLLVLSNISTYGPRISERVARVRWQASLANFNSGVRAELLETYPTLATSPLLTPELTEIMGRNVLPDAYEIRANAQLLQQILICVCAEHTLERGNSEQYSEEVLAASRRVLDPS